jgi:hypothetical protein
MKISRQSLGRAHAGSTKPCGATVAAFRPILSWSRHRKFLPVAFTEHGAVMAATVFNSARAAQMTHFDVRAFIGRTFD